jgi:hypothetical protein
MMQRYIDEIESTIGSSPAILSSTLQKKSGPDGRTVYLKGTIAFIDMSTLEISIFATATRGKLIVDKYRFHYMDNKSRLIFRYDNAPHHGELSNFPHHKHLPDRTIASTQPDLMDILNEISASILSK